MSLPGYWRRVWNGLHCVGLERFLTVYTSGIGYCLRPFPSITGSATGIHGRGSSWQWEYPRSRSTWLSDPSTN